MAEVRAGTEAGLDGQPEAVLTAPALDFLAEFHRSFEPRRPELLAQRAERQAGFDSGQAPDFLAETQAIREDLTWKVAPPPADLQDRRVEITGPTERRMVINALNSGASVFMADFEDSNTPTWRNLIEGQQNLMDAVRNSIRFQRDDGRVYELTSETATLIVRPHGWHLDERHVLVDGAPVSDSLFDFGLFAFHNVAQLLERGSGPYFYLAKLENHLEARLWDDVFSFAEDSLGLTHGSIRATVLIETILAAFELDEILFELRDHSAGCNAGRWDYIFCAIKNSRTWPEAVQPERGQVAMTVPFMRSYTELLVKTCHQRGAQAIGGMAAFIPSCRDPDANAIALARVREDKRREADDGFDGTWVAQPDLTPVAKETFDAVLGSRPNQIERQRPEVSVQAVDLLAFAETGRVITEDGLRANISVSVQYLDSWLGGTGAAAISNLMEDVATAEMSRAQIWQWIRHGARLNDGRAVRPDLVREILAQEIARLPEREADHLQDARSIFEAAALGDDFVELLTQPALNYID